MCFLGPDLECTNAVPAATPAASEKPVPAAVSPGPLGAKKAEGPQCISCEIDKMIVDQKIHGPYIIKLSIHIAANGTVTAVESDGAPSPEIKSRIEQQVRQWIFEPYVVNGASEAEFELQHPDICGPVSLILAEHFRYSRPCSTRLKTML
jgi:hypothetical protein